MAARLFVKQVTVREHSLPHRRIVSFHGDSGQLLWEHTREEVVEHIADGHFHYFFHQDGRAVRIVLEQAVDGELFPKAETDAEIPDGLMQLPHLAATRNVSRA